MLWSSFEHHLTADRVIGTAGDHFSELLEGSGVAWAAVTDPAQRRGIVMKVLAQLPVLWVWDNVEPITGFPEGALSDWTRAEQNDLVGLLRDLAQHTRCKVLVTSRRGEHHWLGDLPARVRLPPMPMRESLQLVGNPDFVGKDAVPELTGLDHDAAIGLLDRAAGIGLLESLGPAPGYYQIHPALPWFFTTLFTTNYGQPGQPAARCAVRAYTKAVGKLGDYYHHLAGGGRAADVVPVLRAEEANLRHASDLARASGLWGAQVDCLQGLNVLYERTGRDGEWARLIAAITPDFTNPDTGGPVPNREKDWSIITGYRVQLAVEARDWLTATALQTGRTAWNRDRAAEALDVPAASLTPAQRHQIRNLGVSLTDLGNIVREQGDPDCLPHFQEALALDQRIGDRQAEAVDAFTVGDAYLSPGRNLDQAEHWFRRSLILRAEDDWHGRARCLGALGGVALDRFNDALATGDAELMLEHLNAALHGYQQALDLTDADDHELRAIIENELGTIESRAGDTRVALRHYQQAIRHNEARGNIYGAGAARYNIARLLADDGRVSDALHYARAALDNFQHTGPGAADSAEQARRLIADLEQRDH